MTTLFYYFLRSAIDDSVNEQPYLTEDFLGEVGDFIELDGVGYYVEDYAMEDFETETEMEGDSMYW
jgi:hypothetical protein